MFLLNIFKINVARNNEEKACEKTFHRKKVCAKLTHYGQLEVCQLIIAKVKNKSPADTTGKTPLHLAGQFGHIEICELILKNASDKNTRDRKDLQGKTPFEIVKSAPIKKAKKAKLIQLFESYKCE